MAVKQGRSSASDVSVLLIALLPQLVTLPFAWAGDDSLDKKLSAANVAPIESISKLDASPRALPSAGMELMRHATTPTAAIDGVWRAFAGADNVNSSLNNVLKANFGAGTNQQGPVPGVGQLGERPRDGDTGYLRENCNNRMPKGVIINGAACKPHVRSRKISAIKDGFHKSIIHEFF